LNFQTNSSFFQKITRVSIYALLIITAKTVCQQNPKYKFPFLFYNSESFKRWQELFTIVPILHLLFCSRASSLAFFAVSARAPVLGPYVRSKVALLRGRIAAKIAREPLPQVLTLMV
jgi:hypothetical protein